MAATQVTPWIMPEDMKLPVVLSHPSPSDRSSITDCIDRLIMGLDTNDPVIFDSAMAEDAQWVLHIKTLQGLKEIHEHSYDTDIVNLDTTHFVTNVRIHMADSGTEATVSTLCEAHHYRGGRGTVPGSARYSTGGVYFLKFVKDPARGWIINYVKIKPIWTEGDRLLVMQH